MDFMQAMWTAAPAVPNAFDNYLEQAEEEDIHAYLQPPPLSAGVQRLHGALTSLHFICKGSFGLVYWGYYETDSRYPVAVKVFKPQKLGETPQSMQDAMRRELDMQWRCSHNFQFVAQVNGWHVTPPGTECDGGGCCCIVMELCCCSLQDRLLKVREQQQQQQPLAEAQPSVSGAELLVDDSYRRYLAQHLAPLPARLSVMAGVVHAVRHMHTSCQPAVLHNDLRAANVLLKVLPDGGIEPRLADFGLSAAAAAAAAEAEGQPPTAYIPSPGNALWVAPEVYRQFFDTEEGWRYRMDASSDVFSLGHLMWEVLSGVLPYQKPSGAWDADPHRFAYCFADDMANHLANVFSCKTEEVGHWQRRLLPQQDGSLLLPLPCSHLGPCLTGDLAQQLASCFNSCCDHEPAQRPSAEQLHQALQQLVNLATAAGQPANAAAAAAVGAAVDQPAAGATDAESGTAAAAAAAPAAAAPAAASAAGYLPGAADSGDAEERSSPTVGPLFPAVDQAADGDSTVESGDVGAEAAALMEGLQLQPTTAAAAAAAAGIGGRTAGERDDTLSPLVAPAAMRCGSSFNSSFTGSVDNGVLARAAGESSCWSSSYEDSILKMPSGDPQRSGGSSSSRNSGCSGSGSGSGGPKISPFRPWALAALAHSVDAAAAAAGSLGGQLGTLQITSQGTGQDVGPLSPDQQQQQQQQTGGSGSGSCLSDLKTASISSSQGLDRPRDSADSMHEDGRHMADSLEDAAAAAAN